MNKIDVFYFVLAISLGALVASCIAPDPLPFAPNSSADPQVRGSSKLPRVATRDETTKEIEQALSATEENAKNAQSMDHNMQNMPGMEHREMQHARAQQPEKRALAEEMKKTSDEMKATSDAMKQKSDAAKGGTAIYTCPMHPQIQSDKPGKCPICGMTLIKKKEGQ